MTASRRLWVPMLVALMVAALIGPGIVAGAQPKVMVTRSMMISAAAAIPISSYMDYNNVGSDVRAEGGSGVFTVPLSFPVPTVTIRRITAYVYDDDSTKEVGVYLERAYPPDGSKTLLGWVATSSTSTDNPQMVTTTAISPRTVNTANYGLYLWIQMGGPGLRLYGVKITYSYEA